MGDFLIVRRGGSAGASSGLASYTYTGDSVIQETENYVYIKLLTSGIFKLKSDAYVDVFLVGGGASGGTGNSSYNGGGGGAGYTKTVNNIYLNAGTEYAVVIGAGGEAATGSGSLGNAGGDSSAFELIANGGSAGDTYCTRGGNGGSGGAGYDGTTGGTDGGDGTGGSAYKGSGQGTTTREFGESNGTLYSTGGDAGGYRITTSGTQNTGNGGDGSPRSSSSGTSGAGGSGIVIIREVK